MEELKNRDAQASDRERQLKLRAERGDMLLQDERDRVEKLIQE
jgi:hypothetical protein